MRDLGRFGIAAAIIWLAITPLAQAQTPSVTSDKMKAASDLDLPLEGDDSPNWIVPPNGDTLQRYYPALAQFMSFDGAATIRCSVAKDGRLFGCTVISEWPLGLGFGAATVAAASDFRMKPEMLDGVPVVGVVTIPLIWKLGTTVLLDDGAVAQTGPPPADAALQAARRLVADLRLNQQALAAMEANISSFLARSDTLLAEQHPAERKVLIDDIRQSYAEALKDYSELTAVAYAKRLSLKDLTQISAFLETPSGVAWRTVQSDLDAHPVQTGASLWEAVKASAKRRFCAQVQCAATTAPAANKK